ncbi:hypothetical protein MMC28_002025 [Mycoblastus sanguinarius]|nr:hypothetical protein [Mycoblastus sanguinarius]
MVEQGHEDPLICGPASNRNLLEPIYKDSPATSAQVPWTAARCQRLLRPLSSKVALLRKLKQAEGFRDGSAQVDGNDSRLDIFTRLISIPGAAMKRSQNSTMPRNTELEWDSSSRPRKRVKRTYTSKFRAQESAEHTNQERSHNFDIPSQDVLQIAFQPPNCPSHSQNRPLAPVASRAKSEGGPFFFHQCLRNVNTFEKPGERGGFLQRTTQVNVKQVSFKELIKRLAPSNWRLIDGIYKGLEAVLKATSSTSLSSGHGCRSLFSTCLRKTPEYIAEQQLWTKLEDPESDVDISSEVYSDLESFHSAPENGWKPLREVVRSHGSKIVGDAIKDGLIELAIAPHIIDLCLKLSAYDEAQCILDCMVALMKPVSKSALIYNTITKGSPIVLNTMQSFAARTDRCDFFYRQLAAMLENEILPVDFVSSKVMVECWNGVIRSIAQEDQHAQAATELLQTAISKSYKKGGPIAANQIHDQRLRACLRASNRAKPRFSEFGQEVRSSESSHHSLTATSYLRADNVDDRSQMTISSVLTVLTAISLIRSSESALTQKESSNGSLTILQDLARQAHQALALSAYHGFDCKDSHGLHPAPLRLPLLAAGIATMASGDPSNAVLQSSFHDFAAIASLPFGDEASTSSGFFLSAIAQCCGRMTSADAFTFMQSMVQGLSNASTSSLTDKLATRLCGSFAVAGAFAFSEDTGQPKHIDWALEVEQAINSGDEGSPKASFDITPARRAPQTKGCYRWEEGICEWIAKTPALQKSWNEVGETPGNTEAKTSSHRQTLPLTGLSPRSVNKRVLSPIDRPRSGGRAYLKCVEIRVESCGGTGGTDDLDFTHVSQPRQYVSYLGRLQNIYVNEDTDELSAPESSQENLNVALKQRQGSRLLSDIKRKRHVPRNQNIKGFNIPRTCQSYRTQPNVRYDSGDTEDELSTL